MTTTWILFDLGNTLIKLAYERVLENICRKSMIERDSLVELLEQPGGYRDLERGQINFLDFYEFLCDHAGYRGSVRDFRETWSDFFDGPIVGAEELLDRVRKQYRVAFLSNSNEVHAEVIPRQFRSLFRKDDRFIFSYRFKVAKPDPEMFRRSLEVLGALAQNVAFVDDLSENVASARALGMTAYQFVDTETLITEMTRDGLL
jgi:glucose-1-phosphatase